MTWDVYLVRRQGDDNMTIIIINILFVSQYKTKQQHKLQIN